MKKAPKKTEAGQQTATAHEAHYTTKDLNEALGLYRAVMVAHSETREAGYSRWQIQNIMSAVVPQQALSDAQVELALVHVAHSDGPGIGPNPVAPAVADAPAGTTWMASLRITAIGLAGLWALGMATSAQGDFVDALALVETNASR